jgi:hypothetical protein
MQRNENESFTDYKIRRAGSNKAIKAIKRGVVFHDSSYEGTYVNKEKRAIKAERAARKAKRNGK